jgi:ClpP class serine protease
MRRRTARSDAAALKAVDRGRAVLGRRGAATPLIDKIGQVEEAEAEASAAPARAPRSWSSTTMPRRRARRFGQVTPSPSSAARATSSPAAAAAAARSAGLVDHSDDTAKAIYEAIEDKDVKAIVFRVSSPGGSPEASEQILAAVRAAKAAGKPVVVSMGDYAASGGYWISSPKPLDRGPALDPDRLHRGVRRQVRAGRRRWVGSAWTCAHLRSAANTPTPSRPRRTSPRPARRLRGPDRPDL